MDLNHDVWIAGFPWAAREEESIAKEYSAPAKLRKADMGSLYRLTIAAENAPKDPRTGAASRGGVLLRQRDVVWLLGVVQQVPKAFGAGSLEGASLERAWASEGFKDLIEEDRSIDVSYVEDLGNLPGIYEGIGAEAYAASRQIFDAAVSRPFVGRDEDFEVIDNALANHDRGLILLRAEPGLGKTTFAARWADHCVCDAGTTVLRHAFSVRAATAGTRARMLDSLMGQAAIALGAEELGEGTLGDAGLRDRLAALIARDQPSGTRLIVVLDGLDEAAERIEPGSDQMVAVFIYSLRAEPRPARHQQSCVVGVSATRRTARR